MTRASKLLLILSILGLWGCGLVSAAAPAPSLPPAATAAVSPAPENTSTAAPQSTAVPSVTEAAAATATLTAIPNALGSLPGAPSWFANVQSIEAYRNPTGTPVKVFRTIPIMPQATVGQDYNNGVYSYKANATLSQAVKFYSAVSSGGAPPMIGNGFGGLGAQKAHQATLLYSDMFIYIQSYDNDTGHVFVLISR